MDTLPVYLGADVVRSVIELDTKRFQHHRNKHFIPWDFAACPIPKYVDNLGSCDDHGEAKAGAIKSFEVVHARDVIQHMPIEKGVQAVKNIMASG
jgi:hypothetical protein